MSPRKASPKKAPTPKKRKPGRHKRGSGVQTQLQTRAEPEVAQSFSSADLDASMQDLQEMNPATDAVTSSMSELVEEKRVEMTRTGDEATSPDDELSVPLDPNSEEKQAENTCCAASEGQNTPDVDMVAETIINGSSSLEESRSAPSPRKTQTREDVVMNTSKVTTISSQPVALSLPVQADVYTQTEGVVEATIAQGVTDKLRSLIGDLRTAALSKEDIDKLEDMFMEAKQQLYGAGRRGMQGP